MRAFCTLALIAAATTAATTAANAQDSTESVTRRQIVLNGKPLRYTARAGLLPIRENEAGEVRGNMFYVAYTVDRAPGAPARPLTFVWNGGPGANSTLVHLVGFGPRRVRISDDPAAGAPVTPVIEDNTETWLDVTDLVFVDPIGTGYSRPAKPEHATEFYSTLGDIASVTEFIRTYRTHFDAWDGPLFLAGESYGTWRAAGVAEALENRGQRVAGVLLISGGIPFGPVATDAARTAMFVPNRTATAFYHRTLAPDLQRDLSATLKQSEQWATDVYAPAVARRDSLGAVERDSIIAALARFTGVQPSDVDRNTLAMSSPQFTSSLLRAQQKTLGRYDMRLTGQGSSPDRAPVMLAYLRDELRFRTDLTYQGLEPAGATAGRGASVGARWNWNQAPPNAPRPSAGSGDGPPGGPQPWLRRAMMVNPKLRAFVAAGLYDSLNGCADNAHIISRIDALFRANFTAGCYGGGHMMYDVATARRELKRDVAAFLSAAR
ncbi:MAG TPA: hypothetical protein VJR92_08980 [Gemmatimonadaceae bacterium]|nr:hypothetical protein [Gemmatimonadaceae bacterium]